MRFDVFKNSHQKFYSTPEQKQQHYKFTLVFMKNTCYFGQSEYERKPQKQNFIKIRQQKLSCFTRNDWWHSHVLQLYKCA